jgi:hypothetical protein
MPWPSSATDWYNFGFRVIPLEGKSTVFKWPSWLSGLSHEVVATHWQRHPFHGVGMITTPDVYMLDADTPQALATVRAIEAATGIYSNMVVKTKNGYHFWYRRAPGTHAHVASFNTEKFPGNVDIRTSRGPGENGNGMAVLPTPGSGRELLSCPEHANQLVEVDQAFLDMVQTFNGRPLVRPYDPVTRSQPTCTTAEDEVAELLAWCDPECAREDWIKIGMALHHWDNGGEAGRGRWHDWSLPGSTYDADTLDGQYDRFDSSKPGGVTKASIAHYAEQSGANLTAIANKYRPGFDVSSAFTTGDAADGIATRIKFGLDKIMGASVEVHAGVIRNILAASFWSPKLKQMMFLSGNELLQFSRADVGRQMTEVFGPVFSGVDSDTREDCFKETWRIIVDHVMRHRQRSKTDERVDMFAETARVEILDDVARVVYKHKLFVAGGYDDAIIDDYLDHWPEFVRFLEILVACRFVADRKTAHVWMHCPADWGKTFFMGVLQGLGCAVQMSVKEIETALEGGPVGRDASEFKTAFVLFVDEFKTVRSELKQLQNTITLSPKYQMAQTVQLYLKVFMSAESVSSLVGGDGVENQFAARFSYFTGTGVLNRRPLFDERGGGPYFESVSGYAAQKLNTLIDEYRAQGKAGAAARGESVLKAFRDVYAIGKSYALLDDVLPELGADLVFWASRQSAIGVLEIRDDGTYMRSPRKRFEEFLTATRPPSELKMLAHKRDQVLAAISVGDKGYITHRLSPTENIKAVLIKPELLPTQSGSSTLTLVPPQPR